MPSDQDREFHEYERYPLNVHQSEIERLISIHLHSELEEIAPSLFVTECNDCRIDNLQAINVGTSSSSVTYEGTADLAEVQKSSSQMNLRATHVSSLSQLTGLLEV